MTEPTKYIEANAILAAQQEDEAEVRRQVLALYPGERETLRRAALRLIRAIDNYAGHMVVDLAPGENGGTHD